MAIDENTFKVTKVPNSDLTCVQFDTNDDEAMDHFAAVMYASQFPKELRDAKLAEAKANFAKSRAVDR